MQSLLCRSSFGIRHVSGKCSNRATRGDSRGDIPVDGDEEQGTIDCAAVDWLRKVDFIIGRQRERSR